MTSEVLQIFQYMRSSPQWFTIPVYQRKYDWQEEQCQQLFEDVVTVHEKQLESHFFGCIVAQQSDRRGNLILIDGQQRLTTVTLLLLALRDLLLDEDLSLPENPVLQENIRDCLFNREVNEEHEVKLIPSCEEDVSAFDDLVYSLPSQVNDSNLTKNYTFFKQVIKEKIESNDLSPEELFKAMDKLQIVAITTSGGVDNPQLIFESLNATGLSLKESDKVRNYVLMCLPSGEQERCYTQWWSRIESLLNGHMDDFLHDYLSIKLPTAPSVHKIYREFKRYLPVDLQSIQTCIEELWRYAKRYNTLLEHDPDRVLSPTLKGCITRLNRLKKNVVRPFLLEVLRMKDEGRLSLADTEEVFFITESFIVRRRICGAESNALNKIFLALHREIESLGETASYLERFKYAITSKRESWRFPNDDEFFEKLLTCNLYLKQKKSVGYFLERFENFGTREDRDVYRHLDGRGCAKWSIEHIMPQTLTRDWLCELGPNAVDIHQEWCHRLANLTLTAYNSEYSNKPFSYKKECENGFIRSGIRLNQDIARFATWNLEALKERSAALLEQAKKLWPRPESTFQPNNAPTLKDVWDNPHYLSGRILRKICYKGHMINVDTWKEAYVTILTYLNNENTSWLERLAQEEKATLRSSVSPENGSKYASITGTVYAYIGNNTPNKIKSLITIFRTYDLDATWLTFILAPQPE